MRIGLLTTAVVALLGGCGGEERAEPTNLTISLHTVDEDFEPQIDRFFLRCEPAGGTLPRPEDLCAALADDPALLNPPGRTSMCAGGISTPSIAVQGVAAGKPVDLYFRCDGFPEARRRALEFWFEAAGAAP